MTCREILGMLDGSAPGGSESDSEAWERVVRSGKGPRLGEGGFEGSRVGGASPWEALWAGRILWEGPEG